MEHSVVGPDRRSTRVVNFVYHLHGTRSMLRHTEGCKSVYSSGAERTSRGLGFLWVTWISQKDSCSQQGVHILSQSGGPHTREATGQYIRPHPQNPSWNIVACTSTGCWNCLLPLTPILELVLQSKEPTETERDTQTGSNKNNLG